MTSPEIGKVVQILMKENSLQKLIPSRNDIAYRKEKENEETRERTRDVVVTFPFKQHDLKVTRPA